MCSICVTTSDWEKHLLSFLSFISVFENRCTCTSCFKRRLDTATKDTCHLHCRLIHSLCLFLFQQVDQYSILFEVSDRQNVVSAWKSQYLFHLDVYETMSEPNLQRKFCKHLYLCFIQNVFYHLLTSLRQNLHFLPVLVFERDLTFISPDSALLYHLCYGCQ